VEKNSTIVFPLPIDILTALLPNLARRDGEVPPGETPELGPSRTPVAA
jgi:hypothetical protein